MKYLSLFSGIGGFEYGINRAYTKGNSPSNEGVPSKWNKSDSSNKLWWTPHPVCIGYSEIDKYARRIYEKHFPGHKWLGDITKINTGELEDFDLLVGGFPCQAFSIAGKRGGFSDTRGTLFFEIARILTDKRPKYLLLENVKGLLSHDKGKTFETILEVLSDIGYVLQWEVCNSKNFGVPQNRERVFIIGHLRGERRPEVFPIGEAGKENIHKTSVGNIQQGVQTGEDALSRSDNSSCKDFDWDAIEQEFARHPQVRRLTPTECERLQGFLDGWTEGISDTQRYKCLGNAVTTNVITEIVKRLYEKRKEKKK